MRSELEVLRLSADISWERTATTFRPRNVKTLGILSLISLLLGSCSVSTQNPAPPPIDEQLGIELRMNQEAWAVSGFDSYTYTLSRVCLCPENELGPFEVTVYERKVAAVEFEREPVDLGSQSFYSVPELFELVERAITDGADEIKVEYDGILGYPTQILIDWDLGAADEETIVSAQDLKPIVSS